MQIRPLLDKYLKFRPEYLPNQPNIVKLPNPINYIGTISMTWIYSKFFKNRILDNYYSNIETLPINKNISIGLFRLFKKGILYN